jgi:hypothetical protein
MKSKALTTLMIGLFAGSLLMGCKKISNDPVECWDPNWLVGTWEGTTPSSITPFENTKIRIVIRKATLVTDNTLQGGAQRTWAYDGTFTWDVDGAKWDYDFLSTNYPSPDYNVIIWTCLTMTQANTTVNNISLRVADTIEIPTMHTINLDWGPVNHTTDKAPTQVDYYGDASIDQDGNPTRAEYPPESGSMIRMKKK